MRVVAVGGGHGLAASLRAIRTYASEIAAVVSVADDGGSSGRLRDELAIPPPGDLRRCLSALASEQSPWASALEHRFDGGGLEGHALGNLIIAGLTKATGDFQHALDEVGRISGAVGRVYPAALQPVTLAAEVGEGATVTGQVAISNTSGIRHVTITPSAPEVPSAALGALAAADQVVLGPGSIYTSVVAALAVPGVRDAVASSAAQVVYVANLVAQPPEATGYSLVDHCDAIRRHGIEPDVILADQRFADEADDARFGSARVALAMLTAANPGVHDAELLGQALKSLAGEH